VFSFSSLAEGVLAGNAGLVESEVKNALSEGLEASHVLEKGLIAGMITVGERFRAGDMYLPEVLMSAKAMHKGLEIVRPRLAQSGQSLQRKVVMGTVEGDIHDIGKRIVGTLIEGNGFNVIDLGVDLRPEVFVQAVEDHRPDVLGMSAMLTTTMTNMKKVIDLLKEKGLREKVKVVVGGAPVSEEFAESIGADGYAPDAGVAAELVRKLVA
jgi:5-methyltetrahydrofolate--homocysteine methyltransferase